MHFPRLLVPRIAVWRTPHDLHVGGPDSPLVLNCVPPELADTVELLDGYHSIDELSLVSSESWTSWLLSTLDEHGFLADGPEYSPRLSFTVHGTGDLGERISMELAHLPPNPHAEALHIVATAAVEVDRVLIAELLSRRVPHLLVRVSQYKASVGPFVIPGLTSCVTCGDLARREMDPTWPVQVFQLSRIETHPTSFLSSWASALAAVHAEIYARGLIPESASTTIEMMAHDARVTYRPWSRHPECPCRQL